MRFSIFTPTHNTQFLKRLNRSIQAQTYTDFEWLIIPNGDLDSPIEDQEGRVRIIPYTGVTANIGELKRFACEHAQGEILVEVDHDDELTPDCLLELSRAFEDDTVDFVYSNCCEILNNAPHTYNLLHGWQYRPFIWNCTPLLETISFDPSPASFSKIWYAPNHVRAWRKTFYDKIGGHDKALEVCDDQDLVCRSYIHGNVEHIDKCLYIYHHTGVNSSACEKNKKIQDMTLELHDKYIYPLVEKWCDLNGLRKIDLCGGFDCPSGYESVDLAGSDIIADLNQVWPFHDGEVGAFRAFDAIEHLKDSIHTFKEFYRCLAPNGWALISVPSSEGRGGVQDPTHCSFFNSNSFFYYCKAQQARYINTPVKFQGNRIKNHYPSEWHQFHDILYVKADLLKFSGRTPGVIEI